MTTPIEEEAARLIQEIEDSLSLPLSQRAAGAIAASRSFAEFVRRFCAFHAGYRDDSAATIQLASKLLDAIEPLLDARGPIYQYIEGHAPKLRRAFHALKHRIRPA